MLTYKGLSRIPVAFVKPMLQQPLSRTFLGGGKPVVTWERLSLALAMCLPIRSSEEEERNRKRRERMEKKRVEGEEEERKRKQKGHIGPFTINIWPLRVETLQGGLAPLHLSRLFRGSFFGSFAVLSGNFGCPNVPVLYDIVSYDERSFLLWRFTKHGRTCHEEATTWAFATFREAISLSQKVL